VNILICDDLTHRADDIPGVIPAGKSTLAFFMGAE
jgi:hypothetical protein